MSTRGCVAIGTLDNWTGVYNHFDSYPLGLGLEVWDLLKYEDLNIFAEELLKFDDWGTYLVGGICKFCGKKTTQPHSICYNISISKEIHPDPECKYHMHTEYKDISEAHINNKNVDPFFIEWVYIIDPQNREFHILSSSHKEESFELKGTYKLDLTEPNWDLI